MKEEMLNCGRVSEPSFGNVGRWEAAVVEEGARRFGAMKEPHGPCDTGPL